MSNDNGPIVAPPTITEAKQKNVGKSDEKCPDLEARIILNKNIHHSVITALQFASHGKIHKGFGLKVHQYIRSHWEWYKIFIQAD